VWHEEMIVFLWRDKKITEASGPCLCRFAPNRLRWSMNQRAALLLDAGEKGKGGCYNRRPVKKFCALGKVM